MGKKGRHISKEVKEDLKKLNKPMEQFIAELPVKTLLRLGDRVLSSNLIVKHYYNKQYPQYHLKKDNLIRELRHAWAVGAFQHREQIVNILKDEGYLE